MPCTLVLPLPLPDLPDGLSLSLPFPTVDISIPFPCCRLPPLFTLHVPNPFGKLLINPAFIAAIKADIAIVKAYKAKLQVKCPRV